MKVAEDAPDATETLAGTATALLLLVIATIKLEEAAALSDTVQEVVPAPVNELVAHKNALIDGVMGAADPLRLIETALEIVPSVAVSVTVCEAVTLDTVAAKVAVVAPCFTDTEAGTLIALLLLARMTVVPPLGADELRVTVQLSVPAAVIDEFAQLIPVNEVVEPADPLPCNLTVPATFTFELVTAFTLS